MHDLTHYQILGVPRDADPDQIQRAYRVRAKSAHPDTRSGDQTDEQFARLAEAYRVLSDPHLRRAYDAGLASVSVVSADVPGGSATSGNGFGHFSWHGIAGAGTGNDSDVRSEFDDLYDTFFGGVDTGEDAPPAR